MNPLSTHTIVKLIYCASSVLFLALGIFAITKDYSAPALFAGIFPEGF